MFNQNINVFKIVTIAISVIIGIVAILIFSGKFPGVGYSTTTNKNNVTIEMWGSISKEAVDKAIMATTQATGKPVQINYTQVNKADLTNRLTQADAAGRAPDLILSDSDVMDMTSGLFYVIPYTYMSELDYNNMYIDASHIYTYPAGALMYPVLADPLVMYYNKKTFRENGLTSTPSNWTELPKYQSVLTSRDADSIPVKSAFGLGANNVTNQKDILVANLMQTGHSVAKINSFYDSNSNLTNNYYIDLGVNSNFDNENMQGDLQNIIRFQTAFSNPQKTVYTWSELDNSDYDKFLTGNNAIYFGKASDYYKIASASPNLEFGIAFLPQLSNKYNVTTGTLTGVAISKSTKDFPYAVSVAQQIAGNVFSSALSQVLGVSSARKDVLAGNDGSARATVVGSGAITMQTFYNLNFSYVDTLVYKLYDDVLSGRKTVEKAVESFDLDFNQLYKPSI